MSLRGMVGVPLAWRLALFCGCVAAGGLLGLPPKPPHFALSSPVTSKTATPQVGVAGRPALATAYPAVALHPLFHANRQPWQPPPPIPAASRASLAAAIIQRPPATPPPKGLVLVGVMIGEGVRIAFLVPASGRSAMAVHEGEVIGGWKLLRIARSHLHFELAGNLFDLDFPSPASAGRR